MINKYRIILMLCLVGTFSHQTLQAQNQEIKQLKNIRNADSAMIYADQLLAVNKAKHDNAQQARILYQKSKIIYRTGDIVKALDYARQALKLTSPADPDTYANSSTMIAYMLSQQGKDVEALGVAFKILHETDTRGWKKLNIYSLACVADLYRNIKAIPKALSYATQAANGAKQVKDSALYIFSISTLSNLYSDQTIRTAASVAKAVKYMDTILNPPYFKMLSPFDKARYLSNMGRLYVVLDDPRAQLVLEQSLVLSRKGKFTKLERAALIELMTSQVYKKRYAETIRYGEQILKVGPLEQFVKLQQQDVYEKLVWAYEGMGDYKQAFRYQKIYTRLNDSTTAVTKAKNAAELDKKYQADKRLFVADAQTQLATQQRNFILLLALIIFISAIAVYRWVAGKRERTALLLAKEHQQLTKLDELKSRFFANISHELRTPLTLIMGPANQLLNKKAEDEEQEQNYLLTIIRNSKKLLNIVNELLDLGKLEAGKLQVRLKPVALRSFFNLAYQSFTSAAQYKEIGYYLVCNVDEQLFVQLDLEKLEKMTTNLIGNAVKFTPYGGLITVTAGLTATHIEFTVSNTGLGIHPNDLPYIFDRYYQGHEQQSLDGGTGIGLALTREFAELLGGSINIKNNYGEGTEFKVVIPLILAEGVFETIGEAEITNAYLNPVPDSSKPLVMIVEDNREMSAYIISVLQPTYTLVAAYNGQEALTMLQSMPKLPSLIVSDVMMPVMDGYTLLDTLKHDLNLCTIPIIMLTALADSKHRLKALNIGVDDYLTKPFITTELIARVTNLVNNAAARIDVQSYYKPDLDASSLDIGNIPAEIEYDISPVSPSDLVWLAEVEAAVRKYVGKIDLNLAMLSADIAISERQLFRRIKNITGLTPNKYIRIIRLQIAREAIESGKYRTIAEIAYVAGFETPAYFSKLFKEYYGTEVSNIL